MASCFFIGHRNAPESVRPLLDAAVERQIAEYGVNEFVVGHYGGFDRLAAGCLADAKETHPELRLTLLLPYHPSDRRVELPRGFDGSFYPPGMENVPRRLAVVRANEYMAKHCDLLICYAVLQNSNPGRIMRKVRPGCAVVNLAEDSGTANYP